MLGERPLVFLRTAYAAFALFAGSILVHLIPFWLQGSHPLGYDTGFYRRYLTQPFESFPNAVVPGLGDDAFIPRLLLDSLRFAGLPPDAVLYGSYLLAFALLPVLLYIWLRPYIGTRGAFIAGVLLIFSGVSYTAYWYMLFKNALALDLLLLAGILLDRKRWRTLFLVSALIALTHKTSAIIYELTLLCMLAYRKEERVLLAALAAMTGAMFLLVNPLLVRELSIITPTAVFLTWREYLLYSLPFLLAIFGGIRYFREWRFPVAFPAFALIALCFPLLHLPFYERIFVFSDIALIVVAAYAIEALIVRSLRDGTTAASGFRLLLIAAVAGLLVGGWMQKVSSLRPLLPPGSIGAIERIADEVPPEAFILTSSEEAPWYQGWTRSHIAAPGLLYDNHNFEEWDAFWQSTSTAQRLRFFASLPHPLYISTLLAFDDLIGLPPDCFVLVHEHLYKDECAAPEMRTE